MASAVASDSNSDFSARSCLALETPPSSSPFPSPSSSFIPPPVPGVHEFATLPSKFTSKNCNSNGKKEKETDENKDKGVTAMNGSTADDRRASRDHGKSLMSPSNQDSPIPSPITPTPPPLTPTQFPGLGVKTPTNSPQSLELQQQADMQSLSASRPAPPSPAPSRRTSAAPGSLSRHSSKSSTRPSTTSSIHKQSKSQSRLSQLSTSFRYQSPSSSPSQSRPLSTQTQLVQNDSDPPLKAKRRSFFFAKIRDFAFSNHDDRFTGKGPDVPRPNRYPKRMSTLSYASSSSTSDDDDDDDRLGKASSWGGFKWGFGGGGWGFGNKGSRMAGDDHDAGMPSKTDFERNFADGDAESPDDEDMQDEDGEETLYPGLYRALYSFIPEGTAEMALEEDQVVRVIGRGGGVGWAVVARPEEEGGGHALVPESYLELVVLDEDDD